MIIRKLQKSKLGQYFLSLPNQILKVMRWEKGDDIEIYVDGNKLILIKK